MTIRSILVPLDGTDTSITKLPTAHAVASLFGSHLEVLYLDRDPKDSMPYVFGTLSSRDLRENVINAAQRSHRTQRQKLHDQFQTFCTEHAITTDGTPGAGLSARWIEAPVTELVARGRLNDLICVIRTPSDTSPWVLESTLLETGRPVLLVPESAPTRLAQRIVIGWNDSPESVRAISASLPFLHQAQAVTILASEKRAVSAGRVAEYLAWHEITATVERLKPGGKVGPSLLSQAKALDADLFVIGSYSRARASQILFGGVTQYFLKNAEIPTLMAH